LKICWQSASQLAPSKPPSLDINIGSPTLSYKKPAKSPFDEPRQIIAYLKTKLDIIHNSSRCLQTVSEMNAILRWSSLLKDKFCATYLAEFSMWGDFESEKIIEKSSSTAEF
jgi:hypothetical protein